MLEFSRSTIAFIPLANGTGRECSHGYPYENSNHRLLLLVPQTSSRYLANASATSRSPHLLPTPVWPFVDNAFLCIVSNCRFSRCNSDKVIVLLVGKLIFSGVCEGVGESALKAVVGSATVDDDGFMPI